VIGHDRLAHFIGFTFCLAAKMIGAGLQEPEMKIGIEVTAGMPNG